jgi:hypothetical protein
MEDKFYLFVGLNDGTLISLTLNKSDLTISEKKYSTVGCWPLTFREFKIHNKASILVTSDEPAVITFAEDFTYKISIVCHPNIIDMLDVSQWGLSAMLYLSENCLSLSSLDENQKLKYRILNIQSHNKNCSDDWIVEQTEQ